MRWSRGEPVGAQGRGRPHEVWEVRPDVFLMDVRMPVLDGIAATRQITSDPDTKEVRVLDRERQVLAQVGKGLSNEEIAERLFMSPATAKTHVVRTMSKLNAGDRAHLVVIAYETGLVTPGG